MRSFPEAAPLSALSLETGDLVLQIESDWWNQAALSVGDWFGKATPFTHVGIAFFAGDHPALGEQVASFRAKDPSPRAWEGWIDTEPLIFHVTRKRHVEARPLRYLVDHPVGCPTFVRPLHADRSAAQLAELAGAMEAFFDTPFEVCLREFMTAMTQAPLVSKPDEDLQRVFCAELTAATYQRMGLLPRSGSDPSSNQYSVWSFGTSDLPQLAPGASLGAPVRILPRDPPTSA